MTEERALPWLVYRWVNGTMMRQGIARTLPAAKNLVDLPFRPGDCTASNIYSGEQWIRRGGAWFPNYETYTSVARPPKAKKV